MSTINSKALLAPYSLTVTQFAWPCLLSSFWHVFCHPGPPKPPTSGCPCLPARQTLTVSHFFLSKGRAHSLGTDVSNHPTSFPSLLPNVPLHVSHFGLSSDRKQRRGRASLWQKLKLGHADRQLVTQDVLMSISREMDSGRTEWW